MHTMQSPGRDFACLRGCDSDERGVAFAG